MSDAGEPRYPLLWKGRRSGPFTLAAIREQLALGEISRMHQVESHGRWILLDDFIEQHGGADPEARRRAEGARQAAQSRRDLEEQLTAERARQAGSTQGLSEAGKHSPHAKLLPRQTPPLPPPLPHEGADSFPFSPVDDKTGGGPNIWMYLAIGFGVLFLLLCLAAVVLFNTGHHGR